ncbi:putative RDD family membrane protein YckC [Clavibacter sp. B3I6]|nr:putative RDD family membrane protein YckC [Clavibacter sp. B3I6]
MSITESPANARYCSSCGKQAGGAYCGNCGSAVTGDESGRTASPALPLQPPAQAHGYGSPSAGYVPVASVASQTSEFVHVAGVGVLRLGSIGQRALARILDYAVITVGYWILFGIFAIIGTAIAGLGTATYDSGDDLAGAAAGLGAFVGGVFLIAVASYIYEVAMVSLWGRTVGKMIVGLRIIRAADGTKPNVGNAFLRWIAPGLAALLPFIGPIGALIVLLSPTFDGSGRRQGWHDKMASTLVVSARQSNS